jgi:hypothetical protein
MLKTLSIFNAQVINWTGKLWQILAVSTQTPLMRSDVMESGLLKFIRAFF